MFKVNRIFPESQVKTYLYEDWVSILKNYYHVDTIFKADGQLWLCNEIKNAEYVKIKN